VEQEFNGVQDAAAQHESVFALAVVYDMFKKLKVFVETLACLTTLFEVLIQELGYLKLLVC